MNSTAYNPLPGIDSISINQNPTLVSPYSTYEVPFYQTRESLTDIDAYRSFIKNVELRFRRSATYSNYKGYIIGLGMDHCQVHGYISSDMAELEMHHAILTLFDLALIITEHFINTVGYVSTFDVVQTLKEEHKSNNIALVMLSQTPHQLYHAESSFYIHPSMCFGNWPQFLDRYSDGLTQDIAFKLLYYIKQSLEHSKTEDNGLLDVRDKILDWSEKLGYIH